MDPIIRAPETPSQDRTVTHLRHARGTSYRSASGHAQESPRDFGKLTVEPAGRGGPVANASRGASERLPSQNLPRQRKSYVAPAMTAIAALALAGIALHQVFG